MMVITWEGIILVIGALSTVLGAWFSILRLKRDIIKSIKSIVCSEVETIISPFRNNQIDVLRYNITRAHSFYMAERMIDKYNMQALEALYRDYHALNQNGFVDNLMKELRELPTTPTLWERYGNEAKNLDGS